MAAPYAKRLWLSRIALNLRDFRISHMLFDKKSLNKRYVIYHLAYQSLIRLKVAFVIQPSASLTWKDNCMTRRNTACFPVFQIIFSLRMHYSAFSRKKRNFYMCHMLTP